MGALFVGMGEFNLASLNARLRENGYQALPSLMPLIGGEGHAVFRNGFIFGARGAGIVGPTRSGPGELQTQLGGGFGLLDFGYAFVHSDLFLLSLSAGIGGYGMSLDISNNQSQRFDAVLRNPAQGSTLSHGGVLVAGTFAFDGRIPLGGTERGRRRFVALGLRLGMLAGPPIGGWGLSGGANASHGPALGLNGGFLALAVGFGGEPRRRLLDGT
jgi:hypothetical protein